MTAVAVSAFQLTAAAPGTLAVSGVLNFDTATAAWQAMRTALDDGAAVRLDLAGVQQSDSAGLSCVIAVLAESARRGRALQAVHIPGGMLALARVCEIDQLLSG